MKSDTPAFVAVIAVVVALTGVTTALPSFATPPASTPSVASLPTGGGGKTDWLWTKYGYPYVSGYTAGSARVKVDNYDINTGQRYRINADAGGSYEVNSVWFNGVQVRDAVGLDTGVIYVDRASRTSINKIEVRFGYSYLHSKTTTVTITG